MSKETYKTSLDKIVKKVGGKYVLDDVALTSHKKDYNSDQEIPCDGKDILGFSVKINTKRYDVFPERLPVDALPRPVDEHSRMGLYENKRDLYLTIANAFNKVMERIETLETEVDKLKK